MARGVTFWASLNVIGWHNNQAQAQAKYLFISSGWQCHRETCQIQFPFVIAMLHCLNELHHGRLSEMAGAVALGLLGAFLPERQHSNVPTQPDAAFSFPVRLDGTWCTQEAMQPNTGICAQAKAAGIRPWTQVPSVSSLVGLLQRYLAGIAGMFAQLNLCRSQMLT